MKKLDIKLAFKKPYFIIDVYDVKTGKFCGSPSLLFNSRLSAMRAVSQYRKMYHDRFAYTLHQYNVYDCLTENPLDV